MTTLSHAPGLKLGPVSLAAAWPWQALTVALLAAALALGLATSVPDVTWLLYAGEKMLRGQRLYVDVLEVNPPLAVLAYLPAVQIGRLLGVQPEMAVVPLVVLGAAASMALSSVVLRPLLEPDPARGWKLAAAAAFVLGVLPMAAFGQREHIAVICLAPFLCVCVLRAAGREPPRLAALAAGLGLGLAVCLKPQLAAAAALPALWALGRGGRRRPWIQLELWAGAFVVVAYAALIVLVFPAYLTDIMPVARDAYLPIRAPWWQLLILPAVPLALAAVFVARLMKLEARWLGAPLMAMAGGALAFLAQGKGWPYHAYPMLAFAALGLLGAAAMTPPAHARAWTWIDRAMLLAAPLAAAVWLSANVDSAAVTRQVAALGPAPRLIAVTGNLGVGLPVARAVDADWIGSECSEWISDGVLRLEEAGPLTPVRRARLESLMAAERSRLSRDIVRGRPEVVLFDRKRFDWRAWALKDPDIAAALKGYRLAAVVKGIEVWARPGR